MLHVRACWLWSGLWSVSYVCAYNKQPGLTKHWHLKLFHRLSQHFSWFWSFNIVCVKLLLWHFKEKNIRWRSRKSKKKLMWRWTGWVPASHIKLCYIYWTKLASYTNFNPLYNVFLNFVKYFWCLNPTNLQLFQYISHMLVFLTTTMTVRESEGTSRSTNTCWSVTNSASLLK